MITPQARRRITHAVLDSCGQDAIDRWAAWENQRDPSIIRTDVPDEIESIALDALASAKADLLNDLGYVEAIETALISRRDGQ